VCPFRLVKAAAQPVTPQLAPEPAPVYNDPVARDHAARPSAPEQPTVPKSGNIIHEHDVVALRRDMAESDLPRGARLQCGADGKPLVDLSRGASGVVVWIAADGVACIVEFFDDDGDTLDCVMMRLSDVELAAQPVAAHGAE
jgi:hypothetical protein